MSLLLFRVDRCVVITAAAVWMVTTGLPFQLSSMVLNGLGTIHLLRWGVLLCFITPLLRCFTALWLMLLKLPQLWVAPPSLLGRSMGSLSGSICSSPALPTPRRPPDLPHTLLPPWWRVPKTLWVVLPCPMMCLRHLSHWGKLVIVTLQRLVGCLMLGTADSCIAIPSHGSDLVKHNYSGSAARGRTKVSHKLSMAQNDMCLNIIPRATSPTWDRPYPATPRLNSVAGGIACTLAFCSF